jgi:hypothetical protein
VRRTLVTPSWTARSPAGTPDVEGRGGAPARGTRDAPFRGVAAHGLPLIEDEEVVGQDLQLEVGGVGEEPARGDAVELWGLGPGRAPSCSP